MPSRDTLSRRAFLAATTAGAAGLAINAPLLQATATPSNLAELSAVDAVAAMRRGDMTAEQYASALLARCAAAKSLNAFITLRADGVLAAARSADQRRKAGAPLGRAAWAADSDQGQCEYQGSSDHGGHFERCATSSLVSTHRSSRGCAMRARSCSARPICTRSRWGTRARISRRAPCTIRTTRRAVPVGAVAEAPRPSRRVSRR